MEVTRTNVSVAREARRVSTGDAGLDRILCGGIFRGAVTIIQGPPGSGKTTLANQLAFENSRRGGCTVYITLLAESHGRLTASLNDMAFYADTEVGQTVHYVSGYNVMLDEGPRGLLRLLGSEARAREANVVVLDGLFVLGESIASEGDFRKFVNDLALQAELMGATVLLLTNAQRCPGSPEFTMVDGWIEVGRQSGSSRTARFVEVHKLRGSEFLAGRHRFRISSLGARALPRLESYLGLAPRPPGRGERVSTGVCELDAMLHGGLPMYSTTLVWGATGTGKTTLGMHFLSKCTTNEPGLAVSFYETPDAFLADARERGIDLAPLVESGALHILWQPPVEQHMDEIAYALLDHVRKHGTRRVFLDGMDGFATVSMEPERLSRFLTALTNELRTAGCTSMYVAEVATVFSTEPDLIPGNRSSVGENILLLRYVQAGDRLRRTLAVLKVRGSDFDHTSREFRLGEGGIQVDGPLDPRPPVPSAAPARDHVG